MLAKRFFKTKDEVEVMFQVDRPELTSAVVLVDVFGWEPMPMKRVDRGKGPFRVRLRLPKDAAVQFRYRFDAAYWENDEAADAYWPNGHGSDNSVVMTSA